MQTRSSRPWHRFSSSCQLSQTIADIVGKLGLSLSQSEVNQLAQGITAGGQAAMALALALADLIADANYQLTPPLVASLMDAVNQSANQNLPISHLVRVKLLQVRKP